MIDIYLEIGQKRTLAGAIEWPGWCRGGRDEAAALQALCESGPRYARILDRTGLAFKAPADPSAFAVVERLEGNATTDFGAPNIALSSDTQPVDQAELQRFQTLLEAYWRAFDDAVQAATGKELRKGPRGGGRDLEGVIRHLLDSDASYVKQLGWKLDQREAEDLSAELSRMRQAILEALAASARGELPKRGPRGGTIWGPREYIRRAAWHVLDHTWEIEDRAE